MKVNYLTAGGLTDVWTKFFSEARSKARREKSAEAIVDTETSLSLKGKRANRRPHEVSKG
jgi:hypothetical protein